MPTKQPDAKDGIERTMLDIALVAAEAQKIALYDLSDSPKQNAEADFDFTLPTLDGNEYLDLVEVVLAGGYQSAQSRVSASEMADHVFGLVMSKARKYGVQRRATVHLLLYTTHWKFFPSGGVISLLTLLCHRHYHDFKTVAFVAPMGEGSGVCWRIFPSMMSLEEVKLIDEKSLRQGVFHNLNPTAAKLTDDGRGITWDVPL